jgi:prepilin-type N-terminal cleavage/methylation domain-containing protein
MQRKGFSLIEVMTALVILGIVTAIFFQTSKYSTKNQGKTRSWEGEAAVMEKVVEDLRSDYNMTQLQNLSTSWVDSSQGGSRYSVKVQGSVAPDSIANASSPPFPANMLAQIVVTVKKVGDTDSLKAATILWVN